MTKKELKELRKIAESATKGPWTIEGRNAKFWDRDLKVHKTFKECWDIFVADPEPEPFQLGFEIKELEEPHRGTFMEKDVYHIATFSPTTVLKLLDALEVCRDGLRLASVRLDILTGRMRGCHEQTGKHELLDEAQAFVDESRQAQAKVAEMVKEIE